MKHHLFLAALVTSLFISPYAFCEQNIQIDMADSVGSLSYPLAVEEKVKVKIINLAPRKLGEYRFGVVYKDKSYPKLDLPAHLDKQIAGYKSLAHIAGAGSDPCEVLINSFVNLKDTDEEAFVPQRVKALNDALAAVPAARPCTIVGTESAKDSVERLIKSTTHEITLDIVPDRSGVLTIADSLGKPVKRLSVNDGQKNKWVTTFGFGFYEARDRKYYSKSDGAEAPTYTIQEQYDRSETNYTAQVVFTYPFHEFGQSGIELGFSAGLGASQESIQAMLGLGLIFGKNVVFSVGYTMQETTVLNGNYAVGDDIGPQPLDSDILKDTTYKGSMMGALTFRF